MVHFSVGALSCILLNSSFFFLSLGSVPEVDFQEHLLFGFFDLLSFLLNLIAVEILDEIILVQNQTLIREKADDLCLANPIKAFGAERLNDLSCLHDFLSIEFFLKLVASFKMVIDELLVSTISTVTLLLYLFIFLFLFKQPCPVNIFSDLVRLGGLLLPPLAFFHFPDLVINLVLGDSEEILSL